MTRYLVRDDIDEDGAAYDSLPLAMLDASRRRRSFPGVVVVDTRTGQRWPLGSLRPGAALETLAQPVIDDITAGHADA